MEPRILAKPTEKQYQVLQDAFDYFNEKLFKDSSPQVMLTLIGSVIRSAIMFRRFSALKAAQP